jgi:hypothetical protein
MVMEMRLQKALIEELTREIAKKLKKAPAKKKPAKGKSK